MKFSTKTRYGLRFMVNLGSNVKDGNVQLSDIAKDENISEKYLSQIVIPLKSAGLILSERGANGGYRLARAAKNINLKEIVEVFEGSLYPVDCVTDPGTCERGTLCVTQEVWKKVGDALIITLENINLESLINDHLQRKQILDYSI
jgi:Rrf2 family protein